MYRLKGKKKAVAALTKFSRALSYAQDSRPGAQISKIKKRVNRIAASLNKKWWQAAASQAAVAQCLTASQFSLVTNIAGGNTVNTREGNDAVLSSIGWTIHVTGNIGAANGWAQHVVIIDRQPQFIAGVLQLPQWGQVFQEGNAAFGPGTNEMEWRPNENTKKRFKILKVTRFLVGQGNTGFSTMGVGAIAQQTKSYTIKFKGGMRLKWTDATGTNIIGPHVFSCIVGDVAAGAGPCFARQEAIGRFTE